MRYLLFSLTLFLFSTLQGLDKQILTNLPSISKTLPNRKQPSSHYWYYSGGLAFTLPKTTIGYRFQNKKLGGDISLTCAYVYPESLLSQGLQYNFLFYPKPNLKRQGYLGLSTGAHSLFVIEKGIIPIPAAIVSLGCIGGFQFQVGNHYHFIEGKIGGPFFAFEDFKNGMLLRESVPIPSLSYGISF